MRGNIALPLSIVLIGCCRAPVPVPELTSTPDAPARLGGQQVVDNMVLSRLSGPLRLVGPQWGPGLHFSELRGESVHDFPGPTAILGHSCAGVESRVVYSLDSRDCDAGCLGVIQEVHLTDGALRECAREFRSAAYPPQTCGAVTGGLAQGLLVVRSASEDGKLLADAVGGLAAAIRHAEDSGVGRKLRVAVDGSAFCTDTRLLVNATDGADVVLAPLSCIQAHSIADLAWLSRALRGVGARLGIEIGEGPVSPTSADLVGWLITTGAVPLFTAENPDSGLCDRIAVLQRRRSWIGASLAGISLVEPSFGSGADTSERAISESLVASGVPWWFVRPSRRLRQYPCVSPERAFSVVGELVLGGVGTWPRECQDPWAGTVEYSDGQARKGRVREAIRDYFQFNWHSQPDHMTVVPPPGGWPQESAHFSGIDRASSTVAIHSWARGAIGGESGRPRLVGGPATLGGLTMREVWPRALARRRCGWAVPESLGQCGNWENSAGRWGVFEFRLLSPVTVGDGHSPAIGWASSEGPVEIRDPRFLDRGRLWLSFPEHWAGSQPPELFEGWTGQVSCADGRECVSVSRSAGGLQATRRVRSEPGRVRLELELLNLGTTDVKGARAMLCLIQSGSRAFPLGGVDQAFYRSAGGLTSFDARPVLAGGPLYRFVGDAIFPTVLMGGTDGTRTIALSMERSVELDVNGDHGKVCVHVHPEFGRINVGGRVRVVGQIELAWRSPSQFATSRAKFTDDVVEGSHEE